MKRIAMTILMGALLIGAAPAAAQLEVGAGDSIETVLKAQNGKRVTLRLRSGQEITGTVRMSSARLVQIGAVSGREFFDAVVPLESIEAVLVRTK